MEKFQRRRALCGLLFSTTLLMMMVISDGRNGDRGVDSVDSWDSNGRGTGEFWALGAESALCPAPTQTKNVHREEWKRILLGTTRRMQMSNSAVEGRWGRVTGHTECQCVSGEGVRGNSACRVGCRKLRETGYIAQDRTPGVRNGACSTFFPSVQIDM